MQVFRISSIKHVGDLSGLGAKLFGGRWNDKGVSVVYMASTRAMAMLEFLVHLRPENLTVPYVISTFEIPDNNLLKVDINDLPSDWQSEDAKPRLAKITNWFLIENKFLLMEVPSVLVEEEKNYILNPAHADSSKVQLIAQRTFTFDSRLK